MTEDKVLTAKQLKEVEEITLDKKTTKETLKIALTYHANTLARILKKEEAWWEEIMKIYDLDRTKTWKIDVKTSMVKIIEKDEG